jgi:hypothetical protein
LTSIPHASVLLSSASRAGPSPPCRAAPRVPASLLPTEQHRARRPLSSLPCNTCAPASCPGCAMIGPPSPADTEVAALDAATVAAAPPSDVQPQELAVRLVTDTDRQAAYEAALARLAQAEEEAANASKVRMERVRQQPVVRVVPLQTSMGCGPEPGSSSIPFIQYSNKIHP